MHESVHDSAPACVHVRARARIESACVCMQCVCFAASSTAAKLLAMAMATCTHNLTESKLQNTHSFVRGAHESLQESLHMKVCTCMEAIKHEKRAESAWKCAESARCVESLSTPGKRSAWSSWIGRDRLLAVL